MDLVKPPHQQHASSLPPFMGPRIPFAHNSGRVAPPPLNPAAFPAPGHGRGPPLPQQRHSHLSPPTSLNNMGRGGLTGSHPQYSHPHQPHYAPPNGAVPLGGKIGFPPPGVPPLLNGASPVPLNPRADQVQPQLQVNSHQQHQQHQQAIPLPASNHYQYQHHPGIPTANQSFSQPAGSKNGNNSTAGAVERPWEEYTDPTTGNKYYSNGIVTQWTKPEAMKQTGSVPTPTSPEEEDETAEPPKKLQKASHHKFKTKDEALEAFKTLLAQNDVTPAQKWIEVVKLLSGSKDSSAVAIWESCQSALTPGARKQALAEYQTKVANELRTKERQGRQRAKEGYLKLLAEILPTVSNVHSTNGFLQFRDVQGILRKDDRYHAVEDDATREALFAEFWEEYRKREERRKQSEMRDAQDAFLDFLKLLADRNVLTWDFNGTWESFVSCLDPAYKDSRFMASDTPANSATDIILDSQERDFLFRRFVTDMQRAQEDEHRRTQEDARREESSQRELFRESLVRLAQEGKIIPSSSYNSVADTILLEESSFVKLQQYDRDLPRELFEEFVTDWNELYRGDRLFLSDIVRRTYERLGRNIVVTSGTDGETKSTSYETFCQAMLDEAMLSPVMHKRVQRIIDEQSPISSARLYYNELQQRSSQQNRGSGDAESSEDEGEISEN